MDAAEPSANSISASNLYRLSSLLDDTSYAQTAKETVLAFEAEVEQWPFCFGGMLASVVMGALGVKGVVLVGGNAGNGDGKQSQVLRKVRGETGVGRTVCWVGRGKEKGKGKKGVEDGWMKGRNKLVMELEGKEEGMRVMVCEGGRCREGVEFL